MSPFLSETHRLFYLLYLLTLSSQSLLFSSSAVCLFTVSLIQKKVDVLREWLVYLLHSLWPSCLAHHRWSLITCVTRRSGLRGHEFVVFTEIFFFLQNIFLLSVLDEGREETFSWCLLLPPHSIIFLLEYFRKSISEVTWASNSLGRPSIKSRSTTHFSISPPHFHLSWNSVLAKGEQDWEPLSRLGV